MTTAPKIVDKVLGVKHQSTRTYISPIGSMSVESPTTQGIEAFINLQSMFFTHFYNGTDLAQHIANKPKVAVGNLTLVWEPSSSWTSVGHYNISVTALFSNATNQIPDGVYDTLRRLGYKTQASKPVLADGLLTLD